MGSVWGRARDLRRMDYNSVLIFIRNLFILILTLCTIFTISHDPSLQYKAPVPILRVIPCLECIEIANLSMVKVQLVDSSRSSLYFRVSTRVMLRQLSFFPDKVIHSNI